MVSFYRSKVTRPQHDAYKALVRAQEAFIKSYNWKQDPKGFWHHPKLNTPARYTLRDALSETEARPLLLGFV